MTAPNATPATPYHAVVSRCPRTKRRATIASAADPAPISAASRPAVLNRIRNSNGPTSVSTMPCALNRVSWIRSVALRWSTLERLDVAESFTDTPLLTTRFDEALHYATRHHARQLRKGTPIPYAAHLLAVASLVLEMHGDEDEAIGALLHDVVEDGGGPVALAYIETHFGASVADIVLANSDSVTGEDEKAPWYERKRAYIAAFAHKSPAALRVSLADKLHNARSILTDYRAHGDALWARFGQGQGLATRAYYRSLALAFEAEQPRMGAAAGPYVDELRGTVDAITALAEHHQGPDTRDLLE